MLRVCLYFLLGVLMSWGGVSSAAEGELRTLKVYYLEFPPYYYTNVDRQPDGFLLQKTTKIFHKVGVTPVYRGVPAKRVLKDIRDVKPLVSIGWFKTPERDKFVKFSLPIYKNKPLQILYLKTDAARFDQHESLISVMKDASLVMGKLEAYSLGSKVDQLISDTKPKVLIAAGGYPQLVRMLAAKRFSYLIVAPEEIDVLISKNHLDPDMFAWKKMSDMPAGNDRCLMFSRGISDEMLQRVNQAIKDLQE